MWRTKAYTCRKECITVTSKFLFPQKCLEIILTSYCGNYTNGDDHNCNNIYNNGNIDNHNSNNHYRNNNNNNGK